MRNITPDEAKKYRDITSGRYSNFVLLATELDGIETSVIASLSGAQGDYVSKPLAILVNKDIFRRLKSPGAALIHGRNLILE